MMLRLQYRTHPHKKYFKEISFELLQLRKIFLVPAGTKFIDLSQTLLI